MTTNHCPNCQTAIPAGAPGGFCPACVLRGAEESAPVTAQGGPSLEEVRVAFPQLEIECLIGQGGMGSVYKARQPSLDRIVALKILSPALSRDPAFAERFAREARVLGRLSHPNIVTVYEHGQSGGFYYLLMEYVDGVNLRQAMQAGRFTPEQALAVVPGICDALQAAHAQGIWHRDIKPENILLDARGGVKIADFGIARLAGDPQQAFTLTMTGARLGSAAYMAPEQHEKPHDVDHRADIYSLGVVIYEMLTGELPLGRFKAPSTKAAVDARIDEIVLRTLEKERELRQQSAVEVKTDVHHAAHSPPQSTATTPRSSLLVSFNMGIAAGVVLLVSAGLLTHGSTQGVLMSFAFVLMAVGLIGAFVYRGKSTPIRISRGVVGALVAFILIAACWVYIEQQRMRAEAEAARRTQDAARADAEARVDWLNKAKAFPAVTPPPAAPEPTVSHEAIFHRMNEFANAGNAAELQKYIAAGASSDMGARALKAVDLLPKIAGKVLRSRSFNEGANDPLRRPHRGITAQMEHADGGTSWIWLTFRADEGEWRVSRVMPPNYEAKCRFELLLPSPAQPWDVLRKYGIPCRKVEGQAAHFDCAVQSSSPDHALQFLDKQMTTLQQKLEADGLGAYFKIITPAVKPSAPFGFE